jgi:hypothetical protein
MTTDAARKFLAEIEEALEPATAYRDPSPTPKIGEAMPVAQPGRPPMSQKATDASMLMLAAGAASLPIGGMTSLVLYTLGNTDPTTLTIAAGGSVAFVLAVASLIRAAGRGMQGIGAEHNHYYNGPVSQKTHNVTTQTRGLFAKTINKQ